MSAPTLADWVAGSRPRTLPAAIAPVLAGTGAAAVLGSIRPGRALLALLVALALQIGVNYANDYSDGIRGTDENRVGPQRLVGSGAAHPTAVRNAAFVCFGVAAAAGLALVALSGTWWMLLVGVTMIAAAWFYTGGSRPYGYSGFGELAVFVCFGVVPVLGTAYTQTLRVDGATVALSVATGLLASALLVANNLRDIPTDRVAGKHTLAVRLGEHRTRLLYAGMITAAYALLAPVAWHHPWALLGLLSAPLAVRPVRSVLDGSTGRDLIPALGGTGKLELAYCALVTVGLVISSLT